MSRETDRQKVTRMNKLVDKNVRLRECVKLDEERARDLFLAERCPVCANRLELEEVRGARFWHCYECSWTPKASMPPGVE